MCRVLEVSTSGYYAWRRRVHAELRTEISSMMTGDRLDLGHDPAPAKALEPVVRDAPVPGDQYRLFQRTGAPTGRRLEGVVKSALRAASEQLLCEAKSMVSTSPRAVRSGFISGWKQPPRSGSRYVGQR